MAEDLAPRVLATRFRASVRRLRLQGCGLSADDVIPPTALQVVRGAPLQIEIRLEEDPGSPAPTVTFTLALTRNATTKLYTADAEQDEDDHALYTILLTSEQTNRAVGRYWWDAWRMDTPQLLAIGSLDVQGVVRLP